MVASFLLLLMLMSFVNSQNLSSDQTTILLRMKQHWGNPPSLDSWNSTSLPCDWWPEIQCDSGRIVELHLANKTINGTIPSVICHLKNLSWINLSKNQLSGRIPACLYNCSNLEVLHLSENVLSGTIPSEICQLKNLVSIMLGINKLSGNIPASLYNCSHLEHLDLSVNLLSGTIPGELLLMKRLTEFYIDGNRLFGEIPTPIQAYSLQEIDFTHNNLNGSIPEDITNLVNLMYLDLSMNAFRGSIPWGLFQMQKLNFMSLACNNLTGELPARLDSFSFSYLNLSHNHLSGMIPKLPRFTSSDLTNNHLSDGVEFHKNSTKIIEEAIGCCVVGFVIFGYLARKCWKIARATIASRRDIKILPSSDKDNEWEMISFQKLDFDESNIVSSLTDENLVGNGGSGKVYRVVINETGNTVAVKSICTNKKTDERLDKEFVAEIQTLGTIRHNNIVKLLCCISGKKNTQLLVYQYFENQSLDQWLHGSKREISSSEHCSITKLDWPMRLNIAIGVAQGLCYMHHHCSPPIIHRDIKSSNILLDSEFNAKIADFGMAKMLTRSEDTETASAVVGTFGYIAPEYAYTKKVNVKSDVYSFGVVLFELTTGRKAVRHDEHMNLAGWAHMHYGEMAYIVDSLDVEIKESSFLDQIVAVFRLGVMCTVNTPAIRPSMKDCLNILQDYGSCFSSSDSVS